MWATASPSMATSSAATTCPNRGDTLSGGPAAASNEGLTQQTSLYEADVTIPITYFGSKTELVVGRYKQQVTPLTMYRPDYDAYFDLPWYDDGNYVQDGFKLSTKFGSVVSSIWTGSSSSVVLDGAGAVLNAPLVGATSVGSPFGAFGKPIGLVNLGQTAAAQNTRSPHRYPDHEDRGTRPDVDRLQPR